MRFTPCRRTPRSGALLWTDLGVTRDNSTVLSPQCARGKQTVNSIAEPIGQLRSPPLIEGVQKSQKTLLSCPTHLILQVPTGNVTRLF